VGTKLRWPSFLLSFPCLTFSYTFCSSSHHLGCPPYFLLSLPACLSCFPVIYQLSVSFQLRSREFAIWTYVVRHHHQIMWSLTFLQVSPKLLSWNTVVGSKEVQESSEHHFFLFCSSENVSQRMKRGWLVFLMRQKPNCEAGNWCSARAQSVSQRVPDHVCKKSIDTTIALIASKP